MNFLFLFKVNGSCFIACPSLFFCRVVCTSSLMQVCWGVLWGVKPGEDSAGGVWEVGTATPGVMWTVLPVWVSSKDAEYSTIPTSRFTHSQARSAASTRHRQQQPGTWAPALSQHKRQMMCGLIGIDSGRHTAFSCNWAYNWMIRNLGLSQ